VLAHKLGAHGRNGRVHLGAVDARPLQDAALGLAQREGECVLTGRSDREAHVALAEVVHGERERVLELLTI